MMNIRKATGISLMAMLAMNTGYAAAQTTGEHKIGDSTQAWFALQAEGTAAGLVAPMSGAQASAAHARYLKSFDKPIPDTFGSSLKDGMALEKVSGG